MASRGEVEEAEECDRRGGEDERGESGAAGTAVGGAGPTAGEGVADAAAVGWTSGEDARSGPRLRLVLPCMVFALNSSTAMRPIKYMNAVRTQGVYAAVCQWFLARGWRRKILAYWSAKSAHDMWMLRTVRTNFLKKSVSAALSRLRRWAMKLVAWREAPGWHMSRRT